MSGGRAGIIVKPVPGRAWQCDAAGDLCARGRRCVTRQGGPRLGLAVINIYVGNLPFSTDEQALEQLFSQFGQVDRANVIMDRETGRSRGFGFVEMPNEAEARQAIEALNGETFGGRPLTVNEAKPRQGRPPRGMSEGERYSSGGYTGYRNPRSE